MAYMKQVPLLTLTRKVLFPGIPFYCTVADPVDEDMIFDTVRGRRFVAVRPGRELGEPSLTDVVCLARQRQVHSLPHGGLLIQLLGIARARIRAEVPRGKPYRCVQIEVFGGPGQILPIPSGWLSEACQAIRCLRGQPRPEPDPFPEGLWLDMLCHFLPVPFDAKLKLLEESCDQRRCQLLTDYREYCKSSAWMRNYLPRLVYSN
ncbi:hypothetical protein ABS71_13995 [bacterium SCN 62-11]|nr:MAG: hypothetical protein ABS71_13995 [bacterium SCN 62-11]